jgi:hypothetical protein
MLLWTPLLSFIHNRWPSFSKEFLQTCNDVLHRTIMSLEKTKLVVLWGEWAASQYASSKPQWPELIQLVEQLLRKPHANSQNIANPIFHLYETQLKVRDPENSSVLVQQLASLLKPQLQPHNTCSSDHQQALPLDKQPLSNSSLTDIDQEVSCIAEDTVEDRRKRLLNVEEKLSKRIKSSTASKSVAWKRCDDKVWKTHIALGTVPFSIIKEKCMSGRVPICSGASIVVGSESGYQPSTGILPDLDIKKQEYINYQYHLDAFRVTVKTNSKIIPFHDNIRDTK